MSMFVSGLIQTSRFVCAEALKTIHYLLKFLIIQLFWIYLAHVTFETGFKPVADEQIFFEKVLYGKLYL